MTPPRSPPWAERNWPPDDPCENRPPGECSCASTSAAGSRAPDGPRAVPRTTNSPPSTTSGSAVTSWTTVLSAPMRIWSPGRSCGVKPFQPPPAAPTWVEFTPPSAGDVAGTLRLVPVAIVRPSRTSVTAALSAKPVSDTSDVFEVTMMDLSAPATAAGAGAASAAQASRAAASAQGGANGSDIRAWSGPLRRIGQRRARECGARSRTGACGNAHACLPVGTTAAGVASPRDDALRHLLRAPAAAPVGRGGRAQALRRRARPGRARRPHGLRRRLGGRAPLPRGVLALVGLRRLPRRLLAARAAHPAGLRDPAAAARLPAPRP